MYTKYEVSMSKPVARGGVQTPPPPLPVTMRNGQSMTVLGPLVGKPNEPQTGRDLLTDLWRSNGLSLGTVNTSST